jgi:hypothetical protein
MSISLKGNNLLEALPRMQYSATIGEMENNWKDDLEWTDLDAPYE